MGETSIQRSAIKSTDFFFNDTATTEIYTLSLHDALPNYVESVEVNAIKVSPGDRVAKDQPLLEVQADKAALERSEEHTSELQSRQYLVCRLLLETKRPQDRTFHPLQHELHFVQFLMYPTR